MIIGVTGTNGAGKGTVVECLVEQFGFKHFSAREFILEEVKRRNLPLNRDSTTLVGNELRTEHGPSYIIEQLFARALEEGGDVVIESVRAIGEAEFLQSHGALLWAVDADRRMRYERITKRGSETDHVSFEKFVTDEEYDLVSPDLNKQNILAVVARADKVFLNEGTKESLFLQVEAELKK